MSKKTIILIISIVLIIIVVVFGIWYFKSGEPRTKTFNDFIPFGTPSGGSGSTLGGKTSSLLQNTEVAPIQKLRQISKLPTSGAIAIEETLNDGDSTTTPPYIVRYMERATGYIYETDVNKINPKRISNTTIPKVYKAFFKKNGNSVVLRYLNDNKEIESYYASIIKKEDKNEGALEGLFLQKDIKWISISPDKNKIFYLLNGTNGVVGIKSDFDGGNKSQIFNFPFTEWLSQWVNNKYIYITTKPSSSVFGYIYSISVKNGSMKKIFGGINGLTTLSNNAGDTILYSESSKNGFSTHIYRTKTKEIEASQITTLPEKCVWSKDNITIYCGVPLIFKKGAYPDIWYQGLVSFPDVLWKINTNTKTSEILIYPLQSNNADIDVIKPFLNDSEDYLFFTNKKDMTLWVLNLK